MAVYTDLSDEELSAVAEAYELGPLRACKGIAEGVSNSNYYLDAARGQFILTIFEARAPAADLPFFLSVMQRLAERGFPAPLPLRAKSGEQLFQIRGKQAALVTFLSGVSPKRPSAAQCQGVGAALARMHAALAGFPRSRPDALGPHAWPALIRPRLALAENLRPGLAQSIASDLADIAALWPAGLPAGVIHADLFPDNALFVGAELGGVIDFYFACDGFLAYDLAVCLNSWCFEGRELNVTKASALIGGYESARALSAEERNAIPVLARGAAMRFFATRLADWSETPEGALVRPKDPLEYADKLDFHRKAKHAADYGG